METIMWYHSTPPRGTLMMNRFISYNNRIINGKQAIMILLLLYANQLVTCQLMSDREYYLRSINRKEDDVGTGPDSESGRLYVGEVVSDSLTSATGHDVLGQASYDTYSRVTPYNNEKSPFDVVMFKPNNAYPKSTDRNLQHSGYVKPINDGVPDYVTHRIENNRQPNSIIGTNNLMKYVNDHIEQDSKIGTMVKQNDVFNSIEFTWFPRENTFQRDDKNDRLKYDWYNSGSSNYNIGHKNGRPIESNIVLLNGAQSSHENSNAAQIARHYPRHRKGVTGSLDEKRGGNGSDEPVDRKGDEENDAESERNEGSAENEYNDSDEYPKDGTISSPNRSERLEGDQENEPFQPPPKDEDEHKARGFVSDHEFPRDVPTRLNYQGGGLWARPAPESGIELDFVPQQIYSQTRRTSSVKFLPQEEALADASTAEEIINAPRLREVVSHKKTQEVYEEEGYEDTAYDHGGYKKHSKNVEDIHKNSLAAVKEQEIAQLADASTTLKDHETYLPQSKDLSDHETQGSGQRQVIQKTTPFGTPKLRTWKSEKTTSNEKSIKFLNDEGKSDVRSVKPKPVREGTVGRSITYLDAKDGYLKSDADIENKKFMKALRRIPLEGLNSNNPQQRSPLTYTPHNSPTRSNELTSKRNPKPVSGRQQPSWRVEDTGKDVTPINRALSGYREQSNDERSLDPQNINTGGSNSEERIVDRESAYNKRRLNNQNNKRNDLTPVNHRLHQIQSKTENDNDGIVSSKLKALQEIFPSSEPEGVVDDEDDIRIDPNNPSSFYSGSFVYNKPRMIKLKKSGLPVDVSDVHDYEEKTDDSGRSDEERLETRQKTRNNYRYFKNRDKVSPTNKDDEQISRNTDLKVQQSKKRRQDLDRKTGTNHRIDNSERIHDYRPNVNHKAFISPSPMETITSSGSSAGILSQWTTPLVNPSYSYHPESQSPVVNQENTHFLTSERKENGYGLIEETQNPDKFPTWNSETSFDSLPRTIKTSSPLDTGTSKLTDLISRTSNQKLSWTPRVPAQPDTPRTDVDGSSSEQSIITDILGAKDSNVSYNKPSAKLIKQLTLAHYSNPTNLNVYKPDLASKLSRMITLADELNKPRQIIMDKEVVKDVTKKGLKEQRKRRSVELKDTKVKRDFSDSGNQDDVENDERKYELSKQYNFKLPKNIELVNIESEGTTTEIPVDMVKYPFYKQKPSEGFEKYSPLRYATNPMFIPKKSGRGMEFYESRAHIECEEPSPPKNIVPDRTKDGEWSERPVPDTPRIRGLGDKIQCLRTKYFGKDPLDNPFFKEDSISVPKIFASNRKSNIEDQLGLYVDIMSNINSNSDRYTSNVDRLTPHVRRPTRNITLNDKFKGYGKKFTNGYRPYYGKFNKYSSTYSNENFKQKANDLHTGNTRGENKYYKDHMKIINDPHTSSSNHNQNAGNENNNGNGNINQVGNNEDGFDSFIPSYLPIRDDTVAVNNYKNDYNNACKHYEYLLKPLMSLTPPSPTSAQTYYDDDKNRKPVPPKLFPTSIYSLLNSADKKAPVRYGNRYIRGSRFNTRQPFRFNYSVDRPNNNAADNAGSGSIFHTKIEIKGLDQTSDGSRNRPKIVVNGQPVRHLQHQYYTVIARPKRQTHHGKRTVFYFDTRRNEPRYAIIKHKRHKRNLNFDDSIKTAYDSPFPEEGLTSKYDKIISRGDRNAEDVTKVTDEYTEKPVVRKLSQELILTLNVREPEHNHTYNDTAISLKNTELYGNEKNSSLGTVDTVSSGSDKVEQEHAPVLNEESNKKLDEETTNTTVNLSRLSGGFISRHSPVYSSKYKKNEPITEITPITTSSEDPIQKIEAINEDPSYNTTSEEVSSSTTSPISTTISSRLKVRFPKLTAKPTVAIVPEDNPKLQKPKARQVTRASTTTSTTTTTSTPTPFTTTRMYKPKRTMYKKENTRNGKIVDAFAVLNRQRDGSSERNSNQNFGTVVNDFSYQDPSSTENYDLTTDRPFRSKTSNPRNYHVEHRRITKEEVIKQTYRTNGDDTESGTQPNGRDVTLFDHPDLRDPTARTSKGTERKHDEEGASSNKDETVINETLMYVVDPVSGFGHWASEPRLQIIKHNRQEDEQRNHDGIKINANDAVKQKDIYESRSKSRFQSDQRSNKRDKLTSRSRSAIKDKPALQSDPNSVNDRENNMRQRGRRFRSRYSVTSNTPTPVPTIGSEVIVVRNLFAQVPPFATVATYLDEEVNEDDVGDGIVIDDKRTDSSTPKIIVEPDKRMYYYLPE